MTVTAVGIRVTPIITWPVPASITCGTALGATQLNATTTVPGTFVYTPPATTVLSVGAAQGLSVTFTPSDAANYTTATKTVAITVTKATPVITWTAPANIVYGTALGAAQLNATTTVPGTFVYTPPATTVLRGRRAGPVGDFTPTMRQYTGEQVGAITVTKATPVVTGQRPRHRLRHPLSATQLNATTTVPGTSSIRRLGTCSRPARADAVGDVHADRRTNYTTRPNRSAQRSRRRSSSPGRPADIVYGTAERHAIERDCSVPAPSYNPQPAPCSPPARKPVGGFTPTDS